MKANLNKVILKVILQAGEPLYGLEIKEAVEKYVYGKVLLASIYSALIRLDEKGLLLATSIPGGPERGGRNRIYYQVSELGRAYVDTE